MPYSTTLPNPALRIFQSKAKVGACISRLLLLAPQGVGARTLRSWEYGVPGLTGALGQNLEVGLSKHHKSQLEKAW